MAKNSSGKNTVVIKKKGATGGVNPGGGANVGLKPPMAQPMSGSTNPVGQIPKKRRVIGQGQH